MTLLQNPSYYENVYASLRGAMIDRDAGDKPEDAVLIDLISSQVALKAGIPSSALLITYSMLFYPHWLNNKRTNEGFKPDAKPIESFIGGVDNLQYPLLFNIYMGMIAVSIGCYAKLWSINYSTIQNTILISPNMDHPIIKATQARIKSDDLKYTDARDLFIELMQQEEYGIDIPIADDYIANASFIDVAEANVNNTEEYLKNMKDVDPSYFRGDN